MSNLPKSIKNFSVAVKKYSPEIVTGIGIAGMIVTTVVAVKATPKACKLIEQAKKEKGVDKLTAKETIKTVWKCYIPAVITGTLSAGCIAGASRENFKRNAALATACSLSETALKDYKSTVVETLGEKKAQEVKEAVAKKKVEENPVSNKEVIISDKDGDYLCLDSISGRYFYSNKQKIDDAKNRINNTLNSDMYASLNEFYWLIGLKSTKQGDRIGWNSINGLLDIDATTTLADDGRPCLVINYDIEPRYDFSKLM